MLAHILAAAGHHVGLAAKGRVYSGGRRNGTSGWRTGRGAGDLLDPDATPWLEISPDDVIRHGLGCDTFDVVAVVGADSGAGNGAGDGVSGEAHLAAIRVVARAARVAVYVGESDPCALAIESACTGANLSRRVWYGRSAGAWPGPQTGNRAVLEGDLIVIYDGIQLLARIPLADLLKRHPGVDLGQIVNSAVYASIAAYSLGKKPRDIHRSLSKLQPRTAGQ